MVSLFLCRPLLWLWSPQTSVFTTTEGDVLTRVKKVRQPCISQLNQKCSWLILVLDSKYRIRDAMLAPIIGCKVDKWPTLIRLKSNASLVCISMALLALLTMELLVAVAWRPWPLKSWRIDTTDSSESDRSMIHRIKCKLEVTCYSATAWPWHWRHLTPTG